MKAERAGRLCVIISLTLLVWVLPAAHALPIDADGPSGLSDNADLDDLIVSLTSPTAAIAPGLVVIIPAGLNVTENVAPSRPITVHRGPSQSTARFARPSQAAPRLSSSPALPAIDFGLEPFAASWPALLDGAAMAITEGR
jgi:hypothetical protein